MSDTIILNKADIESIIEDTSKNTSEKYSRHERVRNCRIQTRGVELATRLRKRLEQLSGIPIRHGILDITFYRDDIATRGILPVIKETRIDFNITNTTILLVDDVLFTAVRPRRRLRRS
jgi:pyrimidine operon attenuation protein/uracil phosphoribosyltransferase